MADALYELLTPSLPLNDTAPISKDLKTIQYLNRLSTLSLHALNETEPQSLAQSSNSAHRSLQALSNRSHKSFITSADNLSTLHTLIPRVTHEALRLQDAIPRLGDEAVRFSSKYSRTSESTALDRRKKAMQLARNVDRLSDILEIPTLLSTAVSSAAANSDVAGAPSSTTYSSALDLYSHVKRLQTLYPDSPLIKDVVAQAEGAMKDMTTNLITSLRAQNIRLAAAMRIIGWLRRVAPELEALQGSGGSRTGGALGALFLVCRLANLVATLEALDPLRELAEQETRRRVQSSCKQDEPSVSRWSESHRTERFLKRYIEIFREQSFAIVSLYKNIFVSGHSESDLGIGLRTKSRPPEPLHRENPLQSLPPALATFPLHLVRLLTDTLHAYLPNVRDKNSRESLLTQVLYCAASLGRLGGDFRMILAELDSTDSCSGGARYEWEAVMKKHRELAGRLEQLTGNTKLAREAAPVTAPAR